MTPMTFEEMKTFIRALQDSTIKPNQPKPNKKKPMSFVANYLLRAIEGLQFGNYKILIDELKLACGEAVKAFEFIKVVCKKNKLTLLSNLSNLKMFIDLIILSYDSNSDFVRPYQTLTDDIQMAVRSKIMISIEELLDAKNFITSEWYKTGSQVEKEEEEKTNTMDGLLRSVLQYLTPPGCRMFVRYVPDGCEDAAIYNLVGKTQRKSFARQIRTTLLIWKEDSVLYIVHEPEMLMEMEVSEQDDLDFCLDGSGELVVNGVKLNKVSMLKTYPKILDTWRKNQRKYCLKYYNIAFKNSRINKLLLEFQHPWIEATEEEDQKKFKKALNMFAFVNSIDKTDRSRTILHKALIAENVDMVKTLVDEPDIDINKADIDKMTPLHIATARCCLEIVEVLIQAGADREKKDFSGRKPRDWAKVLERREIMDYMDTLTIRNAVKELKN